MSIDIPRDNEENTDRSFLSKINNQIPRELEEVNAYVHNLENKIKQLPPPISFNEPKSWQREEYQILNIEKIVWIDSDSLVGGIDNTFHGSWMTKDSSERSKIPHFQAIADGILNARNSDYGYFLRFPIKVVGIDGKYYVSTDGRHRSAVLKALGVKEIPVYLQTEYKSLRTTHIVFCNLLKGTFDDEYLKMHFSPDVFRKYTDLVDKYGDSGLNFIAKFIINFITALRKSEEQLTNKEIKRIYFEKLLEYTDYTGVHPLTEKNNLHVDLSLLNESKWEDLAESLFMQIETI